MKAVQAYLTFNGNCREAVTFYQKCLDSDLRLIPYSESPMKIAPDQKEKVLHATISKGDAILMASDVMPGQSCPVGLNFSVYVNCDDLKEAEKVFGALAEGGKITMPLQDTFWGARFGMLIDKFGVSWMISADLK